MPSGQPLLSLEVASWAAELEWQHLPSQVQRKAIDSCRDALSVMVGGARCHSSRVAADFARRTAGDSPLIAGGTSDPFGAAFANGTAAAALDYEDGHREGGAIHPGGITLSAALAAAGSDTTVAEVLTALVAGYEVGLRAAAQLWVRDEHSWYHCTGTAGTIAAAVAAAKVRGLDAEGMHRAMVIAWAHAPMSTFALPMLKESIGWGSGTGVAAVMLAEHGFLRVPNGYQPPQPDVFPLTPFDRDGVRTDPFVTSLGTRFLILETYFKKYASCAYTHAAIEGLMGLLPSDVDVDEIERIEVGTHRGAAFLSEQAPQTLDHAQYSFPYVLSTAVLEGGRVGGQELNDTTLNQAERLKLASRVHVHHDESLDGSYPEHYPSAVSVIMRDGRKASGVFLDVTGLDEHALRAKWHSLLDPVMSTESAAELLAGLADPDRPVASIVRPLWAIAKGLGPTSADDVPVAATEERS